MSVNGGKCLPIAIKNITNSLNYKNYWSSDESLATEKESDAENEISQKKAQITDTSVFIKQEIDIEHMTYEMCSFKCENCDFSTTLFSSFQVHIDICNKATRSTQNPDKNINVCTVCYKKYKKLKSLHQHMRTHEDQCQNNVFNQNTTKKLLDCTQIYEEDNTIICQICYKPFKTAASLKTHERIHTGVKPFECEVCGKTFNQEGNMRVHMRIHTGVKPYKCNICQKCFSQVANLNAHVRIHYGNRPFECDVCCKSFTQIGNLQAHMRIHTGEKPFQCDVCDKSFRQLQSLKNHAKSHKVKMELS